MLYTFLKLILRLGLSVFFRRLVVKNAENIPVNVPLLVVSNHPNTIIDPIIVGTICKQHLYFIAKESAFNTSWKRWLMRNLYMIPIRRNEPNQGLKTVNNDAIFEKCYEFLAKKVAILIFPEGTSYVERRLRKIKTGTARIALGALAASNYEEDIKIALVGLNYSDASRFRSDVLVHVGETISTLDYAELYKKDPYKATKALTKAIKEGMEELIIITKDEDEDVFMQKVEQIYKKNLMQELDLTLPEEEKDFVLTQNMINAKAYFEEHEPERIDALQNEIEDYLNSLKELKLKDEVFEKHKSSKKVFIKSLKHFFLTVLAFPFFLYGFINNFFAYIIPFKTARWISKDKGFWASIMLFVGLFTFSVFYALQCYFVQEYFKNTALTITYFISLPLSGFFSFAYWNYFISAKETWSLLALFRKRENLISVLMTQRKNIIVTLDKAKQDYLEVV
jgi:1-acyl-sn-glycerol-3-phosphate acyltransferase